MFSKKPEQSSPSRPTASRAVASSGNNSTFSVIGSDVTIRGDVEATADLHVDGRVIGDISCASLVQGQDSRIEGEIRAHSARLSGTVEGRIEVDELVVLKTAKIEGDVCYDALTIEQGAAVNGRFAPQGATPAASSSIQDAEFTETRGDSADDASEAKLSLAS